MAGFLFANVHTIRLVPKSEIQNEIDAFLIDRQARGLSNRTVEGYGEQLYPFAQHLASEGLDEVEAITPESLRRSPIWTSMTGRSLYDTAKATSFAWCTSGHGVICQAARHLESAIYGCTVNPF